MSAGNAERFKSVVSAILGVSPQEVSDDLTPDSVDTWDSLNQINLIGALEQEFGVTLAAQNLGDYMTVALLKKLLVEHGVEL
ncbi:MAG: hypothetical protein DCC65_02190 [Planctomycetota bacterium]|nr:MAG: hypothetical protein DCC65_02190 [Planctomycetota bacterium]